MYQHLYSRFLKANAGKQHFGCHSHHYWPDVTRAAMLEYWDDAAQFVDDKWAHAFAPKLDELKQRIATLLNTQQPEQIVFAPNTHELGFRVLSCLDLRQPLCIVTTASEFHSMRRQFQRLDEWHNVNLVQVPVQPFADFTKRFCDAIKTHQPQLVFCSQVFFDSGVALNALQLEQIALSAPSESAVVIDGYHGFMALPTDLAAIKQRVFYLAGGYKYAQGGEGACFMHVPQNNGFRPLYTGWFAEFGELGQVPDSQVAYATDGNQFAGATFDHSACYRLLAVLRCLDDEGLSVARIHAYIQQLQQQFLAELDKQAHPSLNQQSLIPHDLQHHGHFLAFELPTEEQAAQLQHQLQENGIYTDYRGRRLRFGFGLYHNAEDYDLSCLQEAR